MIFLFVMVIVILIMGIFRGVGDICFVMISILIGRNLLIIIFVWILVILIGFGVIGVWYGMVFGRVVDGIYMWWVWRVRKWVNVVLEKMVVYRMYLKVFFKIEM